MASLPEPEIVFTHESDLDGFVSGCLLQRLARILFGKEIPIEPLPANPWATLKRYPQRAWVSDLAFAKAIDRRDWVVIDHHVADQSPSRAQLVHREDRCAAQLCHALLEENGGSNPRLDRLVELTGITDLYQEDHPEFSLASDYARLVKTYHFRPLHRLFGSRLEELIGHPLLELMELKRKIEDPVGLEWSRGRIEELSPGVGYVPTAIGDANHILHRLLSDPALPHEALLSMSKRPGRPITLSIRSHGSGQALRIARILQGGGHPDAAGAALPRSVGTFDSAVIYLREQLDPGEEERGGGADRLFEDAGF